MKDSQDLLINHNLLYTKECEIDSVCHLIDLGCFSKEKNPEIFKKLVSIFDLKPKVSKVYLSIDNADYFYFFDDNDQVNLLNEDAPRLCCSKNNIFNSGSVPLSKQDAILLSKFLIKEYMEIIEDLKCVENELSKF